MTSRTRFGLAVMLVGMFVMTAGLRRAVAGGNPCTATGYSLNPPRVSCTGVCPGSGDECISLPFSDGTGKGFFRGCFCIGDGIYTPIDHPLCALVVHVTSPANTVECFSQGCADECGKPSSIDNWAVSCECGK